VDLGASGASAGPGYPLQFLSPPTAGLRYFRFYPLRFPCGSLIGRCGAGKQDTYHVMCLLNLFWFNTPELAPAQIKQHKQNLVLNQTVL
jgi:hypothetical protein